MKPKPIDSVGKSLTKDLAFLYRHFIDYKEKLREHDSDPKVKEMFRVLMKLEFTYSNYEKTEH